MATETQRARKAPARARLAPGKGHELAGFLLLLVGLLLGISLGSHDPRDPSAFHQTEAPGAPVRNLIGSVGAETSALFLQLLGLTSLLVPLLLLVAAWRRLRRRASDRVVGRGVGAVILLGSLPGLLQLTLGDFAWRGQPIAAGGAFGRLLADSLQGRMHFVGALLVLLAAVLGGATLLVQSTLGDLLAAWRQRLRAAAQGGALAWARRRERRHKEKARARVVEKHLERVREEREKTGAAAPRAAPPAERLDLPLRVLERAGEGEFAVRRVRGAAAGAEPGPPASASSRPAAPARPQKELPFAPSAAPTEKVLPPLNLLQLGEERGSVDEDELVRLGEVIRARCAEFGVEGTVEGINPGPVITVFEFQPAPGVKVSQIVNLQDDLALALKAESVRIDRLAGRSTLGVEVPNKHRALIRLGHLLSQESFQKSPSPLTMAVGMTIQGEPYIADLASMPHLLVAGATGSGKSVGLQSMITSMLYKATREEVQFIFIDPKRIELGVYADIPHLKAEVVVEPKKAANALRWAVGEMERRYRMLAEVHVRSIDFYNRAIADPQVQKRLALSDSESDLRAEDFKPLPYYVIVIDELADLMMVASAEVETAIARLAQMARAVGIHLIVATQRPSVDVLTGTIKANFPCRISFATASRHDSRTILDQVGSEKLLGRGDMLFMPPGTSRVLRLHGPYISEQETAALVRWLKKQGPPSLDPAVLEAPEGERSGTDGGDNDDELFEDAARLVVAERQASASFLQRRMRVGFSRAARLIDMMEREGLLGPAQGSKPREVLVKPEYFEELDRVRED
ncbi:MAG TPA: DNA translocase FtsK 4TM domain-containing protein [Thermoanaerobaculia bacterium]|nr:DNA translocase FtsK 4TM domain-containing protein [Thermoanaerobaculia bacterium]